MNKKIIDILYPDFKEKLINRYIILKQISINENIGRRKLAIILNLNERYVRNETEKLFQLNLINIKKSGMNITSIGIDILKESEGFINEINRNIELSDKLRNLLGIKEVIVSKGSILEDNGISELSKATSIKFLDNIKNNMILGITGGSTVGNFVNTINTNIAYPNLNIIPVRGSLKGAASNQANNLAIILSEKLNSRYSIFYFPDNFDLDNIKDLSKVPDFKNTLDLINCLDMLIFGVGDAFKMANKRLMSEKEIKYLKENKAVAEAFGNYFDINGNIVLKCKSIGISLEQYMKVKEVIAIAGDDNKEEAIIAISSIRKDITLITTEESAKKIINYLDK